MKRVLWVSRHEMTEPQLKDLERIMEAPVELLPWRETVRSADELADCAKTVDALAVVLPPDLLEGVLAIADGRPVLRAVAGRKPTGRVTILPDGRREPEFAFVHLGWEQILRATFRTQRL